MRALSRPRLWPAIGDPAMAGAIRVAFGRLEPAIGEIRAPRIAEGPSAGESANFLEPHPPHLPNLGFGKGPCRLPLLPGLDPGIAKEVRGEVLLAGNGLGVGNSRQWRTIRASGRPAGHGGAPIAVEFEPDSICLADYGVAGRGAERRSDETRASSFQSQPYEILDRLGCPPHLPAPLAKAAAFVSRKKEWSGYSLSQAGARTLQLLRPVSQRSICIYFNALRRKRVKAIAYFELSDPSRVYGMIAARLEYGYWAFRTDGRPSCPAAVRNRRSPRERRRTRRIGRSGPSSRIFASTAFPHASTAAC